MGPTDPPAGSVSRAGPDCQVSLATICREWTRIGCIGFGGPPTHIALLRRMCVQEREWIAAEEFEDGIAATNLLPGPASTQLAIFCAWRLRGRVGAALGGFCFIVPGLVVILALSAVFLAGHPPDWILGAAAGAGAAVPAVAVHAAAGLVPASWKRRMARVERRVALLAPCSRQLLRLPSTRPNSELLRHFLKGVTLDDVFRLVHCCQRIHVIPSGARPCGSRLPR